MVYGESFSLGSPFLFVPRDQMRAGPQADSGARLAGLRRHIASLIHANATGPAAMDCKPPSLPTPVYCCNPEGTELSPCEYYIKE
jgi:hypothetical protein